ncbi:MAG TPA: D-2-hydroxyacid dehydrogenase [Oscillospiraceae bacterium]|nr:D-2-hydroxyacid dehydrogenase [Oscillospiraceae bacterium]
MKKPIAVILDAYTANPGDLNWDYLKTVCELKVYDRTPKELVIERAKDAEIIVLNKVPLDKKTIDMLPNLKFVALLSTGYNVVDCDYLKKKNIPVSNIPSYSTTAVAQMVFSYILYFSNRTADYNASVKKGDWVNCPDFCYLNEPIFELSGKNLGIIGFGKIGSKAAKIGHAFDMNIIVFTPSGKKDSADYVHFGSLDDVLEKSDFITLHCPLNDDTNELVNDEFLSKMKKGSYLINTARGAVVDEFAVANALNSGKLKGYGADVLLEEPPKSSNPLLSAKNTVITPHIAWAGYETRLRLLGIFNDNIKAYLSGKPINVVNE